MTTIQDAGRPGFLAHGIGASGPMDRKAFALAGALITGPSGAAIEFGPLGIELTYAGAPLAAGLAGGMFNAKLNGVNVLWPASIHLSNNSRLVVTSGAAGNYGYVRFAAEIEVPLVLGSRSTNATVGLGGLEGRALKIGDRLRLSAAEDGAKVALTKGEGDAAEAPVRFIWGVHADLFSHADRMRFVEHPFCVASRMDRMGVRLSDPHLVFGQARVLSLVSDAVVAGDIQILGDGTPIVLMRDHQPTGGYPRIGTIIDADLDRFAQLRPGQSVRFMPVSVERAQRQT